MLPFFFFSFFPSNAIFAGTAVDGPVNGFPMSVEAQPAGRVAKWVQRGPNTDPMCLTLHFGELYKC